MADVNRVVVSGRLARDPELRRTPQDKAVCGFAVAVNRRYTDRDGELQEETTFVEAEAWAQTAEAVAGHLGKGAPVVLDGRLRQDRWEDREGRPRSQMRLVADNVEFVPDGSQPSAGRDEGRGGRGPDGKDGGEARRGRGAPRKGGAKRT